ncbi:MAG: tetraether lipid synthase Tes [Candidatus Odinarchaeia archaeon]
MEGDNMTVKSQTEETRKSEKILDLTESVCPHCWLEGNYEILPAKIVSRDGKVYIKRTCEKHGEIEEIYWSSEELYLRMRRYSQDGPGIENPFIKTKNPTCPLNCGYCNLHLSTPALGNLVVTNRCDLNCWYCFFFAERAGYVYEPTLEQIRQMIRTFRSVKPIPGMAIQITGGEPALRDDIVEIIKIIKEEGVRHIQFNTDGIRIAFDKTLANRIREAGVNTLYMSFDGTTPETNPKNHWEVPYAIQNCREANRMGVVFVPTVINTVNDHDLGNIIRIAGHNLDVVRGVNFQPVSLTGRLTKKERSKLRITAPDVLKRIEEQTDGQITVNDWYTVPCVGAINRIIEAITKTKQLNFTNHFACGLATYVFAEDGKFIPIPQFIDVDGFFEYLTEKAEELERGKNKYWVGLKILWNLRKFIDNKKKPKGLKITRTLLKIIMQHDYSALGDFHMKTLFLGMMHFQDLYNYDVNRVKRCNIVYLNPDNRIIPFCAFNSLSMLYRDIIQPKYGMSIEEWEKQNNIRLKDTYYKRDIKKLTSTEIYKKFYNL